MTLGWVHDDRICELIRQPSAEFISNLLVINMSAGNGYPDAMQMAVNADGTEYNE